MIIGHRGASAVAPENTVAAFARAFDDGADGIELDVRLARDGVPVVIHDSTLRRTGLTAGVISKITSTRLAAVDAGTWFNRSNPKLAREEYAEAGVPSLVEVLALCRERAGVVYVELKSDRRGAAEDLIAAVGGIIKQFRFHRRTVVVSFDHLALAAVKSFDSSIRTGALFSPRRGVNAWRAGSILAATGRCGADEILLHRLLARQRLVEKCNERDLPVAIWTVDDPSWVSRAKAFGIHALITNKPGKLLSVRKLVTSGPIADPTRS